MIEIKATRNLVPGDTVIDEGLEFEVQQVVRGRKRSQIAFNAVDVYGNIKPFTVTAHNTKEWRVMQ